MKNTADFFRSDAGAESTCIVYNYRKMGKFNDPLSMVMKVLADDKDNELGVSPGDDGAGDRSDQFKTKRRKTEITMQMNTTVLVPIAGRRRAQHHSGVVLSACRNSDL